MSEIPEHWEIRKIKNVADMLISNVDKHSKPLEVAVKLCNYTDVYKHDFITPEIEFMAATASKEKVDKFKIRINDVLITKDSEDWLDIGIPSLVEYEESTLVCGYHLAILRPGEVLNGRFFYRAICSFSVKTQFSVKANGVTRYGISQGAIKNTVVPLPPLEEQTCIANFLDRKTAQIGQAIAQKQRLIELLQERRRVMIHRAVTQGLNPDVLMKDSGVEWIGKIPAHWEIASNRSLFVEKNKPGNESLPILSVSIHTAVSSEELSEEENIKGTVRIQDKSSYKKVNVGDIAFNMMRAWQGAIGAVGVSGMVSPAYIVAESLGKIDSEFFEYQYRTSDFIQQMNRSSKGITDFRKRLYWEGFKQLKTILPPKEEQVTIAEFIKELSSKTEIAIERQKKVIHTLKEYRATLINSAVTGKIKV